MDGNSSTGGAADALATLYQAVDLLPDNPATHVVEYAWKSMTDNYTKFQIASWGSIIAHEVTSLPQ